MANVGDIAIVRFGADDPDTLSFVLLADLSGETIFFTDNGWLAAGGFRSGEGIFSYVVPGGTPIGTVISIPAPIGTTSLSTSGDAILAYTGSAASPTFLFAVDFADGNATWAADATSSNTSAVPTGLTVGSTALAFGADNGAYSGPTTGTRAEILANIANAANWTLSDAGSVTGPTGFTITSGGTTVSINDVVIAEGDAGTALLTFTVTRSDNSGEFSVDFVSADGTAFAGSDYVATSGTLTFAAGGALTQTVSVTINGDTVSEANETLIVTLANLINVTGTAAIADSSGTGTITNDDVSIIAIHTIQGAGHTSALVGQAVTTKGIVTAVDSNGFFLQAADADADASIATSEAIFVFTSSAPTVAVGDSITLSGTVAEFIPGGAATNNLSTTQLVSPTGIVVQSSGNALPTAIVLGAGGRQAPTEVIDNDNFASFDPTTDGIDYFESLEAMRVTVPTPVAVAATNQFGEIVTVADGGANATGLSARGSIVTKGSVGDGLNVTNTGAGSDYNPERIQIDADSTITPGSTPLVNVGAVFNDITGVLGYNFGNYEVIPTSAITVATPSILTGEVTALTGSADVLTIASYNVLNLDPNDGDGDTDVADGRFQAIATQFVNALGAPDVIALQEVQDNSGSANDGTVSASLTLQTLVNAITAAGGPTYSFIDNSFITNNTNGGQPGGNIRVAYLYNAARVSLVDGSVSTTPDAAVDFVGSRQPLVATFEFNGSEVTVVNNHFSSKGGSSPLFGAVQPATNGSAAERLVQAQNVADYVASLGASAKVVVLGDLNEFTNEESLAPLSAVGLSAMSLTLTETERYSFAFEGNAQELDQAYVSGNLTTVTTLDIVHVNSEFAVTAASASDHDPSVLALNLADLNYETVGGVRIYDAAESLQGAATTPVASNDVVLVRLGSIQGAVAGAESVAYEGGKVFATNVAGNSINVHSVSAAGALVNEAPILLSGLIEYRPGGVNAVAVKNGVVAVGYENVTVGQPGYIALFSAADGSLIKTIQVGVLPDQLTFTPDGSKLLVANEGQPASVGDNPVGSVSIIDMAGGAAAATVVNTIGFTALNGFEATLRAQGLATLNGQAAAADIEPEYISVSADGTRAYVTLQEVNAVAVIDLTNPTADRPLSIQPLGSIDRNLVGNALDTSDRDNGSGGPAINIRNVNIQSLAQPDAIASYTVGGVTYFITANEGDAREVFTDSVRLGSAGYILDPTLFPNAAALKDNANLGRLNVLTNVGDTDGDGDFDQIFTLGGRSISIFRQEADGSITKVRETGGEFEAILAANNPGSFNSNQSTAASSFDTRSDDKGPEPEGVSIGVVGGRTYAFVGLERVGGYMVYDVTDPANANFVTYKPQTGADLGPETSAFVAAADSPTGQALLISGQEISNTVTVYSIQTQSEGNDTIVGGVDAEVWASRGGNDSIKGNGGNDAINGGAGTDTAVFSGVRAGYSVTGNGTIVTDIDLIDGDDGTDTLSNIEFLAFADVTVTTASFVPYRLQLLHLSDGEAGTLAGQTAPNLAALVDKFEDEFANSITLSGGDTFLPGPFLAAGTDPSLVPLINALTGSTIGSGGAAPGVVDTIIHNFIGVEASGIGNHEWDLGSNVYLSSLTGGGFSGAQYASISANLVLAPAGFTADPLNSRFTQTVGVGNLANEEAQDLKARIAPSAVINEGGQTIGLVGATTQILESISSPTGAEILGFGFGPGPNGETNNMVLLAAQLQPVIDDLLAQGVNKIILLSHLQQITFEQQLAPLLRGVDIILAAGSNTRLGDANDVAVAFPGHAADFANTYPILTAGADGKPTVIVNTDNEYTYLGRLVVDFDSNGEIIVSSLGENITINGAYASTASNVAQAWGVAEADLATTAFAAGTRGGNVKTLTAAVDAIIQSKDGNVFGYSNVYLEGERLQVRNQETNLGNVSADANADVARDVLGLTGDNAIVSIKNGGGIRAQIGTIINNPDGTVTKVAPEVGGEVSQLDVENALRFNNRLMVFDTTAQGLLNILNSPNALNPNNGGFVQIGGVRFSYDPTAAVGSRVRDIVLINEFDQITAVIANDGVVVAGAPAIITAVALNFTANGGDGYLIKANAENFRFLLSDGTVSAPVSEALDFTAPANVPANAVGEQQAFAEYFQERYATPGTAFNVADTSQALDTRIQNQAARLDTVLQGDYLTLGTNAAETLNGTAGAETIKALAGNDTLNGNGDNDVLNGGLGADRLNGGDGVDTATYVNAAGAVAASLATRMGTFGEASGDRFSGIENLTGSGFSDVLSGSSGANVIRGGAGNDTINGKGGADQLFGDAGEDNFLFVGTQINTSIDGGDGFDTIYATAANAKIVWGAYTNIESVDADEFANVTITGTAGADLIDLSSIELMGITAINGNAGNDTIIGSAGNDVINGLDGLDILIGGNGNDTITGGRGTDTMTGGLGGDRFVFARNDSGGSASLADTITDFVSGSGDIIDLSSIDANPTNGTSNDAFTFIGNSAFTGTAGELRFQGSATGILLAADLNGDRVAEFFINVNGTTTMAPIDLLL
ncbi:choice-of-anchor I family protein [Sandarakinorhabdus sp.]|uniref:choice-of-anchor I family protein n=1 Tax=Sandarakinorhabdus sp. TaxID=1916663 RepID=UPI00286E5B21|nr:choice-of-anchor I family protein [Sandarakinorhabdus sp.]